METARRFEEAVNHGDYKTAAAELGPGLEIDDTDIPESTGADLVRPPETAVLAYPSNYVEASSTLSHHAAAERLGSPHGLTAVREGAPRTTGTA